MQDLKGTLDDLLDYVRGIWIKKRYVMLTSWLIIPFGLVYVALMPDVYRSEAKIFIDTGSELDTALQGLTFENNLNQKLLMMVQTLKSRENIEKIARGADLDITTANQQEYNNLITELSEDIALIAPDPRARENILTIAYRHPNASVAKNVVQETLDLFVEGALGESRASNTTANRFLDEQILEYEARLSQSEQQMADFQRKNSDLLPSSGTFYSRLSLFREQLDDTRLQINQLTKQKETFIAQLEAERANIASSGANLASGAPAIQTRYDARIAELEAKLDQLKIRFTSLHPEVTETQRLLDSLIQTRNQEISDYLSQQSTSTEAIQSNPLSLDIKGEINRLDGEIASLQVKEENLIAKISDLRAKIDLVPQIEAEQVALNRDYEILKQNYLELLSRRESAELSQKADVSAEDFKFRIIEPPMVPVKPSGPQRLIFYTAVVLVGFGTGIAIAFLISQFAPLLFRASQITRVSEYPVLGCVSHLDRSSIAKAARMRLLVFLLSSGTLLVLYGILMTAEVLQIDLIGKVMS
ncbi:XrtA system polysaccharide chain length determinant [Alteromonas facilis]|uniref:XrtA system polysaccharide chain length determinant n=1 Tax=Alteromonas facilis TaxID=2048004 RepID=UPI000C28E191|nr:XrtA system polysaccharide chain length determinant [Alteromonas facilis]